jgi:hypothetical protein
VERQYSRTLLSLELHEPSVPTGSLSISYADSSVGRNLLAIVEEWFFELNFLDQETISQEYRKRIKNDI